MLFRSVASVLTADQEARMKWVRHRIARPHPISGRKALYSVSGSSFGIEGMPDDEAVDLLDELKRHATQPKYQYALSYGVGDIVVWDNAALLHSATLTPPECPRTLWRDDQRRRCQFGKIGLAATELRSATRRAADGKCLSHAMLIDVAPSMRPPT